MKKTNLNRKDPVQSRLSDKDKYHLFNRINGSHPFKDFVPESVVEYKVRTLNKGRVRYFNFKLAKEMGLVDKNDPEVLNSTLEKILIDTFSINIINEYDIIHKRKFKKTNIKPVPYMATRYLQLQHSSKKGYTSGDGRSIWNGHVRIKGTTWDITSCGTGATKLSPAHSKLNRYIKTGDPSISYGCGCAELSEGLSAALLSEIFHNNGIPTERTLLLIELGNGLSINVRAGQNLLRPSHFLGFLKQGNYEGLKNIVNYYIHRQVQNKIWQKNLTQNQYYDLFLNEVTESFSKMSAMFEDEYIFCWMDWDGDNILMDGGIIDYGSIRQFGLFHHEYRYDDVERWSTNILEQKQKAKYIVQSFVQIFDFLKHKTKQNIKVFANDPTLHAFENRFSFYKKNFLLKKVGFSVDQIEYLQKYKNTEVEQFQTIYRHFETVKSRKGVIKVQDGINWNAIFCMRDILRELPKAYFTNWEFLDNDSFLKIIKSKYATKKDIELKSNLVSKIKEFQECYQTLVNTVCKKFSLPKKYLLINVIKRASVANKYERVTGDGIILVTDAILKAKNRVSEDQFQKIIENFIKNQKLDLIDEKKIQSKADEKVIKIVERLHKIVINNREGI